jgi:hypothetical protein
MCKEMRKEKTPGENEETPGVPTDEDAGYDDTLSQRILFGMWPLPLAFLIILLVLIAYFVLSKKLIDFGLREEILIVGTQMPSITLCALVS